MRRASAFGAIVTFALSTLGSVLSSTALGASEVGTPPICCLAPPPFQPPVSDNRGTAETPLVVTQTRSVAQLADEQAERTWKHTVDLWTLVGTGATIFVLIGQGIAFIFQAHRLKQSVTEMKLATIATQQVALAEQQTVQTMEATARRQLRAYVYIKEARMTGILNLTVGARLLLRLYNFGQTPAYKARVDTLTLAWGQTFDKAACSSRTRAHFFRHHRPGR